jgi:hypothetical protein
MGRTFCIYYLGTEKKIKEDTLVSTIGVAGPWQIFFFLYLSLMVAWDSSNMFNMKFSAYPVDYSCHTPSRYEHLSNEEWLNISAPFWSDDEANNNNSIFNGANYFNRCSMFDLDWQSDLLITSRPTEDTPVKKCKR